MGLFDKIFKRKNKKIETAIQNINEELFNEDNELLETEEDNRKKGPLELEEEKIEEMEKLWEAENKIVEEKEEEEALLEVLEETSQFIKPTEDIIIDDVEDEEDSELIEEEIEQNEGIEEEVVELVEPIEVIDEETNKPAEFIDEYIETSEDNEIVEEEVFEPSEPLEPIDEDEEVLLEELAYEEAHYEPREETIDEEIVIEKAIQEEEAPKKQSFMKRLFGGLTKTRENIARGVDAVLSSFKQIDEDLYEELEEALIIADFGVDTTLHIIEKLRAEVKARRITDPMALKPTLQEIITNFLTSQPVEEVLSPTGPTVLLVIGVNGVGKTTSIGKMAHLFKSQGKRVLVAAADTFRAAAIEQLNVWTERAGVEIIKQSEGSDAAAVVFDAIAAAKSRKVDVLICDTAGRLQNKTNLMKELEKISRIIAREYPEAKKEILIVIDATTGQNALQQVKLFKEVANINGIILTKLDGTAKGGAIVSIYDSLKVPVKYIGVGEKIDDLQPFNAAAFAQALFDETE